MSETSTNLSHKLRINNRAGEWREIPACISKGFALFIGLYCIISLTAGLAGKMPNLNTWWIDLQPLPKVLSTLFLGLSGIFMLLYGVLPVLGMQLRKLSLAFAVSLAAVSLYNTFYFYILIINGSFSPGFCLPLSFVVFLILSFIAWGMRKNVAVKTGFRSAFLRLSVIAVLVSISPLSQMFFFGKSDYRRPADAIVVFGARAYADGNLSDALADRVRTGCELYEQGYAELLVFSGGPGEGEITEPEAMRRFAINHGVHEEAILIDNGGLNTRLTVENTSKYFRKRGIRRILAVSHFYHLPRIKMSYSKKGIVAYTVPARESYCLTQMPYLLVRETAALWYYYFTLVMN